MKFRVAALSIIAIVAVIVGASVLTNILNYPSERTQRRFDVKVAFPNLHFNSPVGIYNAGDATDRLFVVEQAGVIKVFKNFENVTSANVFLDLGDRVLSGGELGLLGLAFHPNFKENGYFYVDYTVDAPRRSVISRFSVS